MNKVVAKAGEFWINVPNGCFQYAHIYKARQSFHSPDKFEYELYIDTSCLEHEPELLERMYRTKGNQVRLRSAHRPEVIPASGWFEVLRDDLEDAKIRNLSPDSIFNGYHLEVLVEVYDFKPPTREVAYRFPDNPALLFLRAVKLLPKD